MTFGRKGRATPLTKEAVAERENLRDDCVALFLDSKLTQKQVHEAGGPTPATISRWLYRETFFPRYDTIERLLRALGFGLVPMRLEDIEQWRSAPRHVRLEIGSVATAMPARKKKA